MHLPLFVARISLVPAHAVVLIAVPLPVEVVGAAAAKLYVHPAAKRSTIAIVIANHCRKMTDIAVIAIVVFPSIIFDRESQPRDSRIAITLVRKRRRPARSINLSERPRRLDRPARSAREQSISRFAFDKSDAIWQRRDSESFNRFRILRDRLRRLHARFRPHCANRGRRKHVEQVLVRRIFSESLFEFIQ